MLSAGRLLLEVEEVLESDRERMMDTRVMDAMPR